MPRINLRDQDPSTPPPDDETSNGGLPPQEYGNEPGKKTPWIIFIALVVVVLAGIVALNQMNIIHLWGPRQPRVVEALPEAAPPAQNDSAALAVTSTGGGSSAGGATGKTSVPSSKSDATKSQQKPGVQLRAPANAPTGGLFAVQVSSWISKQHADAVADELGGKGYHAYVVSAVVNGETWHRVRVGNYQTSKEASDALTTLEAQGYGGLLIQRRK